MICTIRPHFDDGMYAYVKVTDSDEDEEAVRRVGSIAIVHETLSQNLDERVEFDEIADRLHSERIVDSVTLSRHVDYDIDYLSGTIRFRAVTEDLNE